MNIHANGFWHFERALGPGFYIHTHKNRGSVPLSSNRLGPAVRLVNRRASVRFHFGAPLSSKVVVCGHCLVTLSLTANETLRRLSALPILMQDYTQSGGECAVLGIASLPPPPPASCDLGSRQYLIGDTSALNTFNQTKPLCRAKARTCCCYQTFVKLPLQYGTADRHSSRLT